MFFKSLPEKKQRSWQYSTIPMSSSMMVMKGKNMDSTMSSWLLFCLVGTSMEISVEGTMEISIDTTIGCSLCLCQRKRNHLDSTHPNIFINDNSAIKNRVFSVKLVAFCLLGFFNPSSEKKQPF
jgi:hypothetical protein